MVGATGLVGQQLLLLLLDCPDYQQVIAITRKPVDMVHPKLLNPVFSLEKMENWGEPIKADHAFCCLGTTMAKAGSKEAFRQVDFDFCLSFARLCRSKGVEKMVLVSSLGADSSSPVFYSKVKGEAENAIAEMHFKQTIILRPSILLGPRNESRPGEAIGQFVAKNLSFLFLGPLAKYKGIAATEVARAMIYLAKTNTKELRLAENDEIADLAGHYQ